MITLDDRQIKRFENDLKQFAEKAYPFATRDTLNKAAFDAQRRGRDNISTGMIVRNRYTLQSIQVERAQTLKLSSQTAIVGSVASYLATQEFGGAVRGHGKNQPIATSYSAGQGDDTRPRTRLPRANNLMKAIALQRTRSRKPRSRAGMVALAIHQAKAEGRQFVYLNLGRRQGIFRVLGTRAKPRIRMVWDLSHRSVRAPPPAPQYLFPPRRSGLGAQ